MIEALRADHFHVDTRAFFKSRKVAVTGGTGFIGSHVVEQLLMLDAEPVVLTRQDRPKFLSHLGARVQLRRADLKDLESTRRAMQGCSVVLNLAAEVAGIEYNKNHPASIFETNLTTFMNSIHAARDLKVDRYLVTSSACVYPRHCSIPTPETEGFKDEPEPTNSGYGWSKRMEEYLGAKVAEEFGLSVAIARPYNGYGPRDNFAPATSHVIPALIRKAFETRDGKLSVWGDGSHTRSFLFVEDFARGCIEVAARYPKADPLNIGAAEEVTIKQTAEAVAELVGAKRGSKIQPIFDSQGITGQPRRSCDTTKIETVLGYKARIGLREGLRQTVDWYAAATES